MGHFNKLNCGYLSVFVLANLMVASSTTEIDIELAKINERLLSISGKLDVTSRLCTARVDLQLSALRTKTDAIEKQITDMHTLIANQTPATKRQIETLNDNLYRRLDAKLDALTRNQNSNMAQLTNKLNDIAATLATGQPNDYLKTDEDIEDRLTTFSLTVARDLATLLHNDSNNSDTIGNSPQELVQTRERKSDEIDVLRVSDLVAVADVVPDAGSVTSGPRSGDPTRADEDGERREEAASKRNRTDGAGRLLKQLWRQFLKPIFKVESGVDKVERLVMRGNNRGEQSARLLDKMDSQLTELVEKMSATTFAETDRCASLTQAMRAAFQRVDSQFDNVEQRALYQNSLAEKTYDRLRGLSATSCPGNGVATESTDSEPDQEQVATATEDVGVSEELATDCQEIMRRGATNSGIYAIRVNEKRLNVFCDLTSMGGGWLAIQRRDSYPGDQENFSRSWRDYQMGFGDIQREFWLGNDNLHSLTTAKDFSLLVQLSDFEGNDAYATYSKFRLGSEPELYRLHVSGYSGNASDSLSAHDTKPFSTYDRAHDEVDPCCHCSNTFGGGWWFYACFESHLNGPYLDRDTDNGYFGGIIWEHWKGDYSLRRTAMHIRPRNDRTPSGGNGGTNHHWPTVVTRTERINEEDAEEDVEDP